MIINKKKICILDYGSGNVNSVFNILEYLNYKVIISSEKNVIDESTHLILPGVGTYNNTMNKLKEKIDIDFLLNQVLKKKKPFLGICVGMQILSDIGYENETYKGLGWIKGGVKILKSKKFNLPHIGWNNIEIKKNSLLFKNINEENNFYFLHSYIFDATLIENIISTTTYGESFCSAIEKDNIFGVQFHPEKSQKDGMLILNNFVKIE